MRMVLLCFLVAACSSSERAPALSAKPTPPGGAAAEVACTGAADCVVVETACCDHCNGGKAEAFHKSFAASHRPTGCEGTACTAMACGAAAARCDAGVCKVTIEPIP